MLAARYIFFYCVQLLHTGYSGRPFVKVGAGLVFDAFVVSQVVV
jgi:hypothetical protein